MIEKGDLIKVEYEGRFEDGTVFDSSTHGDHSHPLEFPAGEGMVIPGFDNAVLGMKNGEEKEFEILPEEGYGEKREEFIREIPRSALPPEPQPEIGMGLMMHTPQGDLPGTIIEVNTNSVVLDLNHPLAGKKLIFKIKIVEIVKKE